MILRCVYCDEEVTKDDIVDRSGKPDLHLQCAFAINEWKIGDRTVEQINQLAVDIHKNLIFTTRHIKSHDQHLMNRIFMPIPLGALSYVPTYKLADIGLIYEYYNKSESRSINGYPMFMSMNLVNQNDTKLIFNKISQLKEAEQKALKT